MNKLKEIRFYKGITQPLLALRTGIHQSRISLIENELVTPKEEEKRLEEVKSQRSESQMEKNSLLNLEGTNAKTEWFF